MFIACQQWTLTILFMISITSRGKSQIPMGMPPPPMFMPPPPMPMFAAPAPMPMPPPPPPMPAPPPAMPIFMPPPPPMILRIKIPPKPTTTTTTTTESSANNVENNFANNGIAIPFPMPMPIQMGIPAMPPPMFCRGKSRHKGCPPCPPCMCAPSCTPAFFSYCSPCHKKCRCRSRDDTPDPRLSGVPPEPLPGPAYAVAFPPPPDPVLIPLDKLYHKKKDHHGHEKRDAEPESDEWENSASENSRERERELKRRTYRSRRRRPMARRRRHHYYRKSNRMDISDEFVRPEIAYISKDGEVKLSRPLTNDEAANLLGEGNSIYPNTTREFKSTNKHKQSSRVQVIATNNPGRSQLLVMQDKENASGDNVINKKRMLRADTTPEFLASGKKHLIFKPPPDKTISNISVSFMVT